MEAILKKEVITDRVLCRALGVIVFIILTSLGAFVRIPLPFTPVPVTMQTFFVLLSGAFLGGGLGAFSQASYLVLGVIGAPVFTQAGFGMAYLFGPTGGYLAGFVAASLFLGQVLKRLPDDFFAFFGVFLLADFLLLFCGTIWLKAISGGGFLKAFTLGFLPFLIPDILKAALAAGLYLKLRPRLKMVFGS